MTEERLHKLDALQVLLGYRFQDLTLLNTALTHTSFVKGDGKRGSHNERLEYLGDAVLELCVSEEIYKRYPGWSEGEMTRARAGIVCEPALYEAARQCFVLQSYILLGHGEENTGGRDKPSILSDALEALIGAVYLDGGIDEARAFVLRFTEQALAGSIKKGPQKDFKTALQEYAQRLHLGAIAYHLVDTKGPDHKKVFYMQVTLNGNLAGEGVGASKQEAGQKAAKQALDALRRQRT